MRQEKRSSKELSTVFDKILTLISEIEDQESKESIARLFGELGERYFEAPASHRANYHNCFAGGLADHVLRVYDILKGLCELHYPRANPDSIIKVALLHDLGKVGDETGPYYIPQESQWHRDKLGEFYTFNNDIEYMQHAHRSLYMCQRYNIPLTSEEFKAILIHDGQYIDANSAYKNNEGIFSILVHTADMMALNLEKQHYKENYE